MDIKEVQKFFEKAIAESTEYDAALERCVRYRTVGKGQGGFPEDTQFDGTEAEI